MKQKTKKKMYGACPSFFKGKCYEAMTGGIKSYADAGYELMRHIASELPYNNDYDEKTEMLLLEKHLKADDKEKVLKWFWKTTPRCLTLIPKKRHISFINGVFARYEEAGLEY